MRRTLEVLRATVAPLLRSVGCVQHKSHTVAARPAFRSSTAATYTASHATIARHQLPKEGRNQRSSNPPATVQHAAARGTGPRAHRVTGASRTVGTPASTRPRRSQLVPKRPTTPCSRSWATSPLDRAVNHMLANASVPNSAACPYQNAGVGAKGIAGRDPTADGAALRPEPVTMRGTRNGGRVGEQRAIRGGTAAALPPHAPDEIGDAHLDALRPNALRKLRRIRHRNLNRGGSPIRRVSGAIADRAGIVWRATACPPLVRAPRGLRERRSPRGERCRRGPIRRAGGMAAFDDGPRVWWRGVGGAVLR